MIDRRDEPGEAKIAAAFALALSEASLFRGATSPNPPVGCVVLDAKGEILACAAHRRAGTAHAEALALARCLSDGTRERIHTLVVTLEPCNHTGHTAPCCDAILGTPARAIWIGAVDPNPAVKGGGAARLRAAGCEINWLSDIAGEEAEKLRVQCAKLLAPFEMHVLCKKPYVTVKQAVDEWGSMVPPAGRKTFTSQSSLVLAHTLRKRADAVITGSGTILADEPFFTVRHVPDHPDKRRGLFIMDRRRRVSARYLADASARGFDPVLVSSFQEALQRAHDAGALEVLVEAGPIVTEHVLKSGAWDEHYVIRSARLSDYEDTVEQHFAGNEKRRSHVLGHS